MAPSTKRPSRQRLLEAAADLFYHQGIRATGVDAVVAAAGLTKPTLYQHFASKEELVAAVMEYRSAHWRSAVNARVEATRGGPRQRLLAVFRFLEDFIADGGFRGCALVNAAVELPREEDPGRAIARDNKGWNRRRLEELARDAGAMQPRSLACSLVLLVEGAIASAYVEGNQAAGRQARKAAELLLQAHVGLSRDRRSQV
jgi:AcrR family transcriptional regulator